jgi:Ca2+-binding RTX toxin-like protein
MRDLFVIAVTEPAGPLGPLTGSTEGGPCAGNLNRINKETTMAIVYGTNASNFISWGFPPFGIGTTNGADTVYGLGGDDEIYGHGGDDFIDGGFGADTMYGGTGHDD